jgi:predicted XRE-type DNA-binding protein
MSVILRRTEQILMRDGLSRRQVAEALGLSQSKISRLLHGRSAFRSAAEEFHLRHWLYEQEKRYVSALQSCLAKRVDPKTKLLDFSALPSPLPEVSPPQNIVLYLHYLLPLDERRAVDALVTRALGLRNNDALGGQQQQQQQDDESASDEEEEQTKAPAPSPSPPAPAAAAPPAPLSRAERLALRRAQGELDEDGALPSPSSALVQSALAELSNEQLMHADPDALARARKRAKLEDGSAATTAAGTAAAGSNAAATEASEAALADVCGLDAWSLASGSAVRRRLSSLMSLTHSSQTDLSRLLESSSATVSLLLRGEFRYSTKDKFMKSLQRWGRTTDQMLVTKTLALLGADHDHDHDRDHHPAGGANGVKMMEDNNGAVTDGGGNDDDACMFIKRLSPAGDLSEDLLPADAVRLKDLPQAERQQISLAPPSSALEELVLMLLHAGIPLQTDADEVDADEGATTERTRAPTASPSPPSSPLPHPLSLWSWLRFTCRFSARPQLDTVVLPWVERWSDDGAAHDADDDRLPAFAHEEEDDSPAPVTAVWPLARAQIPAAARFRKYVEEHQQGRMLSVGRLGAHNTDDDQRTPQTSLPPSRSVSDQRSVAEDEQPQMDQNEDSAASGVDEDGHVDDDADSSGTPQQQQQEDDEDGGEGQEAEEEDVMMQPMEADEDEEEQDQDQEHEQAVDADDEQEAMVEYQDDEDAGEPAEEEQQEQEVAEEEAAPLQPDEAELHRRLEADEELDEADDADLVAPNDDAAAAATDGAPATADAIPSQHQQSQQEHLPTPPRTTILAEVAKPIDAAPAASPPAGDDAAGAAQAPEVSAAAAHPFTLT